MKPHLKNNECYCLRGKFQGEKFDKNESIHSGSDHPNALSTFPPKDYQSSHQAGFLAYVLIISLPGRSVPVANNDDKTTFTVTGVASDFHRSSLFTH